MRGTGKARGGRLVQKAARARLGNAHAAGTQKARRRRGDFRVRVKFERAAYGLPARAEKRARHRPRVQDGLQGRLPQQAGGLALQRRNLPRAVGDAEERGRRQNPRPLRAL